MNHLIGIAGPISTAEFIDYLAPTNAPPAGLGGTPVNSLARELLSRGRRLAIFTLDPQVTDEIVLKGEQLTIYYGPYRPRRARDFFGAERLWMTSAMLRVRPDLVHAHWTYEFALAAQASRLPTLVTAHDAPWRVLSLDLRPYRLARTAMAHRAVWQTQSMVAVSPYVAAHLRNRMGFHRHVDVIPNGLPEAAFASARVHTDSSVTFVTAANGFNDLKNTKAVLFAFAKVRQTLPETHLTMFGADHGPDEAASRWAKAHGIATNVTFSGAVPHEALRRYLETEADVFVHPSREESHGMALIEAMAVSLPVIGGAKSGAVPWTLGHGTAGLLVDVVQPMAIAAAMQDLAASSEKRQALGNAGQVSARERFHIRAVADAYEDCYDTTQNAGS